jgi:hypothetical protein
VADVYIKVSSGCNTLATAEKTELSKYLLLLAEFFEKARVRFCLLNTFD